MSANDLRRLLPVASRRVSARISAMAEPDQKYARGMASEGWLGGYYAALQDVHVMLNAGVPGSNTNAHLWAPPTNEELRKWNMGKKNDQPPYPKPAVGQVWRDSDPRLKGVTDLRRELRITDIIGDKARCIIVAGPPSAVGRTTVIALRRFRPTQTGYEFVRNE